MLQNLKFRENAYSFRDNNITNCGVDSDMGDSAIQTETWMYVSNKA